MLIGFFGDGNNYDDNMVESNDDSRGNYHERNLDDNHQKDSIKQGVKTHVLRSGTNVT